MNTKEAILFLESLGLKVYEGADLQTIKEECTNFWSGHLNQKKYQELAAAAEVFRIWDKSYFCGVYTGRELVNFAKYQTKHIGPNAKKILKKEKSGKCRAAERVLIKKEDFDKMPLNKDIPINTMSMEDFW